MRIGRAELGEGSLDPQCFRAARPITWRWPIFDRSAHPPRSPPPSAGQQPNSKRLADDGNHARAFSERLLFVPANAGVHRAAVVDLGPGSLHRDQIRLLQRSPKTSGERPVIGVIVHRKDQLENPLQPTEHHNILRCTLQRLPDLLLAKRLPGSS